MFVYLGLTYIYHVETQEAWPAHCYTNSYYTAEKSFDAWKKNGISVILRMHDGSQEHDTPVILKQYKWEAK